MMRTLSKHRFAGELSMEKTTGQLTDLALKPVYIRASVLRSTVFSVSANKAKLVTATGPYSLDYRLFQEKLAN